MTYQTVLVRLSRQHKAKTYYKLRKFQDFQGPRNSDSRTFNHVFKYFQGLEYSGKNSRTFKNASEPCL